MKKLSLLLFTLVLVGSCSYNQALFQAGGIAQNSPAKDLKFDQILSTTQTSDLIFVKVVIDGQDFRFLFDTGAPMVISKELQSKFQFEILSENLVHDSQGNSKTQNYVRLDSLQLGAQVFTGLTAIEADLRYSPILDCLNIDGIVGANLMRHAFWEMDGATGYLRMTDNSDHWDLNQAGLISRPFKVKSTYTPVMDLRVGHTIFRNITFDTGSSDLLSLGKGGNSNYNKDSIAFKAYGILSAGLFGSIIDTMEVQFLDLYLDTLPYKCPIEFESAKDARLLGMSFFKHFRIYMDWSAGMMHFLPHDTLNFDADKSYPTSAFINGDAIIIGQINDLALRQNLSITLGDTILAINGSSIYPANTETYCEVLQLFKNNSQLVLTILEKGDILIRRHDLYLSLNLQESF